MANFTGGKTLYTYYPVNGGAAITTNSPVPPAGYTAVPPGTGGIKTAPPRVPVRGGAGGVVRAPAPAANPLSAVVDALSRFFGSANPVKKEKAPNKGKVVASTLAGFR